eukprot:GHVQ01003563.1.p2 GENE.GHVQ01003563.1~~GHVQ01003563.1.p2  ORF type:complete len:141 (-),score=37.83 GHVQ01003563.1:1279-1701(-)
MIESSSDNDTWHVDDRQRMGPHSTHHAHATSHTYMETHTYTHTCTHTYTHTCTHTYTHTCTHTYTSMDPHTHSYKYIHMTPLMLQWMVVSLDGDWEEEGMEENIDCLLSGRGGGEGPVCVYVATAASLLPGLCRPSRLLL